MPISFFAAQHGQQSGTNFSAGGRDRETATIEGDIINRTRKKIGIRFTVSLLHTRRSSHTKGLLVVLEDISAIQATAQKMLIDLSFSLLC